MVAFDIDEFVDECRAALAEPQAPLAVKDVLTRATATPQRLMESMSSAPGLNFLHQSPDLTVINVVWPPHISLFPHDHRMWAAIAIYSGQEDNAFYRREGGSIVASGGRELHERDVLLLGADAVHAVRNPRDAHTGAIHVYGGDFVGTPRSQWDEETLEEEPFDLEAARRTFEEAQQAFELSRDES